jgi:hypothetical protein
VIQFKPFFFLSVCCCSSLVHDYEKLLLRTFATPRMDSTEAQHGAGELALRPWLKEIIVDMSLGCGAGWRFVRQWGGERLSKLSESSKRSSLGLDDPYELLLKQCFRHQKTLSRRHHWRMPPNDIKNTFVLVSRVPHFALLRRQSPSAANAINLWNKISHFSRPSCLSLASFS